jgi:hypothetical protein
MVVVSIAAYYMEAPHCQPPVVDGVKMDVVPGRLFGYWDSLYWSRMCSLISTF